MPLRASRAALMLVAVMVLHIAAPPPRASGQWSVIDLQPDGALRSSVLAAHGAAQGGWATFPGDRYSGMVWGGVPGSATSLTPDGTFESYVSAMADGQQVGSVRRATGSVASLWRGSAASWVNLHPAGFLQSGVSGTDGVRQVGFANRTEEETGRAMLWSGSAASAVNLHPASASISIAYDLDGPIQVGTFTRNQLSHACLWRGTAESFVDLTPSGSVQENSSAAVAADGEQQVGTVALVGGTIHASVWTGTAGSWRSLMPAGYTDSRAYGADRGMQVGFVGQGRYIASLWRGTPASWIDLDAILRALRPGFTGSDARSISHDDRYTYIGGFAYIQEPGALGFSLQHAILWKHCRADFDFDGATTVRDVHAFVDSYFAGEALADYNGSGAISVQDIFDFLAAYFAGCP